MARARVPLGLIAGAAMLGSHWLAYFLAAPDPHERAHVLQTTGHGYWPVAASIALAALVMGLGSFIGGRLDPAIRTSRQRIFARAAPRLLALQIGGFLLLEVGERIASGHSVGLATLLESTLVIGVAVQAFSALLSATVLVFVAFVVDKLVGTSSRPESTTTITAPLISLVAAPRLIPATGSLTLRGPPARS